VLAPDTVTVNVACAGLLVTVAKKFAPPTVSSTSIVLLDDFGMAQEIWPRTRVPVEVASSFGKLGW
jgi:hypothetical protein